MFRYLRRAGYDVYWFGKNDALAPAAFADSVTEWGDEPLQVSPVAPRGAGAPLTMRFGGGGDRRDTSDYRLLQRAIKVLERGQQERPFCIFLPLFDPHPPYAAPEGFDTMYRAGDVPPLIPAGGKLKPRFHAAIRRAYGLEGADEQLLREVRSTYFGQVSYSDWLLGEMLEALERTGHSHDTAIIASSDHGDYAGDFGLVEKWPSGLEACLTHVPLIIRLPEGAQNHVVHEMNELFDIMPTSLAIAGTRATHTHFARSLIPQLMGLPGDARRAAFSEGGYNVYEPQAFEPKLGGVYGPKTRLQNDDPATIARVASIRTSRYTFIARPQEANELYDRTLDPQEVRNLALEPESAATVASLTARLADWYINTTGVAPGDPRDTPPYYPTPGFSERDEVVQEVLDGRKQP